MQNFPDFRYCYNFITAAKSELAEGRREAVALVFDDMDEAASAAAIFFVRLAERI